MNLGEFINASFEKLGVSNDDTALKDLVTKVATLEISDELVNKFNGGYLTEASAKANPKIQSHFRAQLYNGLDDELKPLYDELGLSDDSKAELHAITSSTKRASALVRKAKEEAEKKLANSTGGKKEQEKIVEELNAKIVEINKAKDSEISKIKADFDGELNDIYLSQFLSGKKYATDGYKDEDFLLPKTKIQKALKERGLTTIRDGKAFKLQTEQGSDYYENNLKVDFGTFADKVLADNKLTAISEPQTKDQQKTIISSGTDKNKISGMAAYDQMISEASSQPIL